MRRGGKRELSTRVLERFQQEGDAGEGLRGGKELRLQCGLLCGEGGAGDGQLGPGMEDLGSLCSLFLSLRGGVGKEGSGGERHTSGPGRPCNWALIFQGREGLPYSCKITLLHLVYMSSVSRRSPSMSKRQARIVGNLELKVS